MTQDAKQPSLLLVEGDDHQAKRFQGIFSRLALHWHVKRVLDGREAIHQITFHGYPDLLITNLETPRLHAIDIAEWLRSLKCTKPVPVLIYGATPTKSQSMGLAKVGVREFLDSKMSDDALKKILMSHVARIDALFFEQPTTVTKAESPVRRGAYRYSE